MNPILSVDLLALEDSLPLRQVLAFSSPTYVCRDFNSQVQRLEIQAIRERFGGRGVMLLGLDTTSRIISVTIQDLRLASKLPLDGLHDVQFSDSASRTLDFMTS